MVASAFLYGITRSVKGHPLYCEDTKAVHEEMHVEKTEAQTTASTNLPSL